MADTDEVPLPNLEAGAPVPTEADSVEQEGGAQTREAEDLEAVFDVPVQVSAVLGRARMEVGDLLKLLQAMRDVQHRHAARPAHLHLRSRPFHSHGFARAGRTA